MSGTKRSGTDGQHSFATIPAVNVPRSTFNRSHSTKTAFDAGFLIPVYVDEALPGDTFNMTMHTFARLATPIHPFMDNLYLDSHFFAVPIRLVWGNFIKMMGEQTNPGDTTSFICPTLDPGTPGWIMNSMHDYMGVPIEIPDLPINILWGRAYNLIWNTWFRDENLQNSRTVNTLDSGDLLTWYDTLAPRNKRHDYFTSCLPWPQKGDAVTFSIGTSAPITATGDSIPLFNIDGTASRNLVGTSGGTAATWSSNPGVTGAAEWDDPKLVADLSAATAATINQLRESFAIQALYEKDARGGTRYTEIVRSHFGVTSPDQRLQRPEYLGGGTQNISITPVPQTSSTDVQTPQGNMAAYGVSTGDNHRFMKSFTEHSLIIGFVSVRADLNYQQGLPRMFSRSSRWDFYWPELAHLGEQAVLNKEIYAQGSDDATADAATFGYQERWSEYRYGRSTITGIMRSQATGTLDVWHLAQDFTSLPLLNSAFIVESPPIARVIEVTTEPHFLFDAYFDLKCARVMPTHSVPGLMNTF